MYLYSECYNRNYHHLISDRSMKHITKILFFPYLYKSFYQYNISRIQVKMDNQEVRGKDIFQSLHKVNLKSRELLQYCIFIFGNSRTGKSTIHNLIMNPNALVGKSKRLKSYFVLRNPSNRTAEIGETYTPVTMMPNVSKLNPQLTLVDFPGLGNRENPIQLIKVNYIYAQFFRTARMVKFILVLTEGALRDISSEGFKETLENFLSFFNFDLLTTGERRQLFSSIALCLTSVDFRGRNNEQAKNVYLQALTGAVEDLEKLYFTKTAEMPWFPYAKELLLGIAKERRIWLFQAAVPERPPTDNRILQSLDRHNWRFVKMKQKIGKIIFQFDQQYKSQSQAGRKLIDDSINGRFSFGLNVKTILVQMLANLINHFGEKQVNIDEGVVAINKILQQMPEYGNPPQLPIKPQVCTVMQRLFLLQRLNELGSRIENFQIWRQSNQQSSVSEYFTLHLTGILNEQIQVLSRLFGFSLGAIAMLNNLSLNDNKMLEQATVFAHLSPTYEGKLKNRLPAEFTFGNEIDSNQQINQKFIQYFKAHPHQIQDYDISEAENIIGLFSRFRGDFRETDPTIFSGILSRLHNTLALKFRSINQTGLFVIHNYNALTEAAISHICFASAPLEIYENQEKQTICLEEKILKETLQVLDPKRHQDQIDHINQIRSGFQELSRRQKKDWLKSDIRNLFKNLAGFIGSVNRSKSQMQLSSNILPSLSSEDIEGIINQYRSTMRSQINEEKLKIELPNIRSFFSQVSFYDKVKEAIIGKNVIFVIGESLCGKSVVVEALKRRKLCLNNGRIDLERQSRSNRINHTNTPSRFPHLSLLNEAQNEFILEVPSYQHLSSQQKYINLALLLGLMKSTKQFRILLVAKEATLISSKESKDKTFEGIFSQIVNMLLKKSKDQQESEQPLTKAKKPKQSKCVITLVVSHATRDKPSCRKILEQIAKGLDPINEKAAKCLSRIIEKNQFICEGVQKNNLIAQDFQSLKPSYVDPSQLNLTQNDLYTQFITEKKLFIDEIIEKISFAKAIIGPLYSLASVTANQFVCGQKPTEKNSYFDRIAAILNNPIASRYETDIWSLPDFETSVSSMDNRPYLFHRLIQLRQLASDYQTANQLNTAYLSIGNYMEIFFSTMVYLCCSNKMQYHCFMRVNTALTNLLKELQYYSLIFTNQSGPQLEDLKENMWPRDIIDATTNFPDFKRDELMSKLLSKPTSWRQSDFKSCIRLLNHYIGTSTNINPVVTAARIELLIFTQRLRNKKIGIDWNQGLTELKLIEAIFSDEFIKKNLTQGHRKSLLKANRNPEENENAIVELLALKRKLLA